MASCVIIYSGVSYHDATSKARIKGALCSCFVFLFFFRRKSVWGNNTDSNIYFLNWINELFLKEYKIHRTLFDERKVAGSAKYKQCKIVFI